MDHMSTNNTRQLLKHTQYESMTNRLTEIVDQRFVSVQLNQSWILPFRSHMLQLLGTGLLSFQTHRITGFASRPGWRFCVQMSWKILQSSPWFGAWKSTIWNETLIRTEQYIRPSNNLPLTCPLFFEPPYLITGLVLPDIALTPCIRKV
jgi:hypothetical protein